MRRVQGALALGVCIVLGAMLAPSTASADGLQFSGRSGVQKWWTCVDGCRPYRIAATVIANVYPSGPPNGGPVAEASFGIFYSTAALSPDTVLIYGFQYRKKGGKWRHVCVDGRCLFDARKQASWPGAPAGGNYLEARLPIKRMRNIQQIRLLVKPLLENDEGRRVGWLRKKTFNVRYHRCAVCALPSSVPDPQPAPPAPAPPPPKDVCAGHPSDPSVVCVRNQAHTVDVCDRHADGHRAYARVITQASNPAFLSPFYDTNNSQPGCANLHFPSRVLAVAACVQYEGCSAFRPAY